VQALSLFKGVLFSDIPKYFGWPSLPPPSRPTRPSTPPRGLPLIVICKVLGQSVSPPFLLLPPDLGGCPLLCHPPPSFKAFNDSRCENKKVDCSPLPSRDCVSRPSLPHCLVTLHSPHTVRTAIRYSFLFSSPIALRSIGLLPLG